MNLSGTSVSEARDFYKIPNEDLLVVCDDLNLPLAKLRIRSGGSAGGQKGLEDIRFPPSGNGRVFQASGLASASRRRVFGMQATSSWPRFTEEEKTLVAEAIRRAAEAVVVWAREGAALVAMNGYN